MDTFTSLLPSHNDHYRALDPKQLKGVLFYDSNCEVKIR